MHLEPRYAAKRTAKLFGLAILALGPLIYANLDIDRQGFKPSAPSLTIQIGEHGSRP
jgi:hypothetical protein